ncbi:hypothetical protein HMPREF9104_02162 [Lentilactobacillus kisonensis F0435]|uniref:Uncharacterized protein n=1 Tax=Lentilactobacillus kisonensis F0435 TaxID=797516 RepID=H1LHS1_9LACO|nr:hypothetical protein HMPREF9104_02162 [Lentilactobacillus kisonensis F0435]
MLQLLTAWFRTLTALLRSLPYWASTACTISLIYQLNVLLIMIIILLGEDLGDVS